MGDVEEESPSVTGTDMLIRLQERDAACSHFNEQMGRHATCERSYNSLYMSVLIYMFVCVCVVGRKYAWG